MRRRTGSILSFLPVFLLTACGEPVEDPAANAASTAAVTEAVPACELSMGWDPWEPYQYRDPGGEVAGLDVEIAMAAAEHAGCDLMFVEGPWMSLLEQLRNGQVSLLAGATRTPGREEFAAFTAPYRSESFVVYTRVDSTALREADELADLLQADVSIGTVAEYYYGPEISAVLDALHEADRLHEAVVAEMNYERLLSGEIDAFVEDPFVASAILRNHEQGARIVPTAVRVDAQDVAFMLSRKGVAPEVAQRFDTALTALRDSGQLDAILARYRLAPADKAP